VVSGEGRQATPLERKPRDAARAIASSVGKRVSARLICIRQEGSLTVRDHCQHSAAFGLPVAGLIEPTRTSP
jgi:hypothetical protein